MGLFDDLKNTVKKGLEVASEKGGQAIKVGQLRIELNSLERERDGVFTQIGKVYVETKGDSLSLEPLVTDLTRLNTEIEAKLEAVKAVGAEDKAVEAEDKPEDPSAHAAG